MKGLKIQSRVFLLALIPSLIISILLGSYIITSRIQDLEKNFRLHSEMILNSAANSTRHFLLKNNPQALRDFITHFMLDENDLEYIAVFDSHHKILAYSGIDNINIQDLPKKITFNPTSLSIVKNKESAILIAPIKIKKFDQHYQEIAHDNLTQAPLGWIAINISRSQILLGDYEAITTTLLSLILGILLSVFLAKYTAKCLTSPLLKMRDVVRKLEKGMLAARVNTETTGEIKELGEGINKMAGALQQAQDELQQNIEQATADLTNSLEMIEIQNIALAKAQKEALEASRVKSEFIANMSHEIRTPMNGMIGFTNLLLETEITSLQRTYLKTIQKSTFNLLTLVNNILDFSRLDAGHIRLETLVFDIRDCIDEVVTIMAPLAHGKQLELIAIVDTLVPAKILGDPLRTKQILTNLLSNAIKFTEKGEVIIRIDVDNNTAHSVKLRCTIKDTGIGLHSKDQKNIFKAFQQADSSTTRKHGGTGLGLAICKRLIDQMGGQIGVESSPGTGATFWFTFTAEKGMHEIDELHKLTLTSHRALLFDPHPLVRLSIKNSLANWNIETEEFENWPALIDSVTDEENKKLIDLIIIGTYPEEVSPNQLVNNLTLLQKHYSGSIIFISDNPKQSTLDTFLSHDNIVSLTKPITHSQLYHAIFQLTNPTIHQEGLALSPPTFANLFSHKAILCVDDNIQNANLVLALLNETDATIKIANSGHEAVALAKNEKFDVILMDLRMPTMDGHEAFDLIRNHPSMNQTTPVIAISAHIADEEYAELAAAGFDDAMAKPIVKAELIKTILKCLSTASSEPAPTPTSSDSIMPSSDDAVDWELALKLANDNRKLAEEMLALLVKNLHQEYLEIKEAKEMNDHPLFLQRLHKLHGAVSYCGVPHLKNTIAMLETALKRKQYTEIKPLFIEFERRVHQLLAYS